MTRHPEFAIFAKHAKAAEANIIRARAELERAYDHSSKAHASPSKEGEAIMVAWRACLTALSAMQAYTQRQLELAEANEVTA